eukprot:6182107-Pleurochrysis_carterae.AAC.1
MQQARFATKYAPRRESWTQGTVGIASAERPSHSMRQFKIYVLSASAGVNQIGKRTTFLAVCKRSSSARQKKAVCVGRAGRGERLRGRACTRVWLRRLVRHLCEVDDVLQPEPAECGECHGELALERARDAEAARADECDAAEGRACAMK